MVHVIREFVKQKGNILNKLHSIKFEPRLCHGDFHPFNLILSKKNVNIKPSKNIEEIIPKVIIKAIIKLLFCFV